MKPGKYETAEGIFKDTTLNITNEGKKGRWSSSWYGGVQKGICDHESKQMGSRIEATVKNCLILSTSSILRIHIRFLRKVQLRYSNHTQHQPSTTTHQKCHST